jgi:serine/threonine protein kinase
MTERSTCVGIPSFEGTSQVVSGLEQSSDYIDLSIVGMQSAYIVALLLLFRLGRAYGLSGAGALPRQNASTSCCTTLKQRLGSCAYPFLVLPAYTYVLAIASVSCFLWLMNHGLDLANQWVPTSDVYSCSWRGVFSVAWGLDCALADGLLLWLSLDRVDRRRAWEICAGSVLWGAVNASLALFSGDPDLDTATVLYLVRWAELLALSLAILLIAAFRELRPRFCPGAIRRSGAFRSAGVIFALVQLAFAIVGFGSALHFEVVVGTGGGDAATVNALALIALISRSLHILIQMPLITAVLIIDTRHWTRQRSLIGRALQRSGNKWRGGESAALTSSRPMLSQRLHGSMIDWRTLAFGAKIGSGSLSMVYRGQLCMRPVAIKRSVLADVTSESVEALLLESELLVRLPAHRNIVDFLGVAVVVPDLCLVMELCACTLRDVIYKRIDQLKLRAEEGEESAVEFDAERGGAASASVSTSTNGLERARIRSIAADIARGMIHLHTHGVVHRDMKCENVLLDEHGLAKVCDFGVSALSTIRNAGARMRERLQLRAKVASTTRWAVGNRFNSNRESISNSRNSTNEAFERNRAQSALPIVRRRGGSAGGATQPRDETVVRLITREEGVGTITHMSPEVLQRGSATTSSDMYAFGVVVWEMSTLEPPWGAQSRFEEIAQWVTSGERLALDGGAGPVLTKLMSDAWLATPLQRPTFTDALARLGTMVVADASTYSE